MALFCKRLILLVVTVKEYRVVWIHAAELCAECWSWVSVICLERFISLLAIVGLKVGILHVALFSKRLILLIVTVKEYGVVWIYAAELCAECWSWASVSCLERLIRPLAIVGLKVELLLVGELLWFRALSCKQHILLAIIEYGVEWINFGEWW